MDLAARRMDAGNRRLPDYLIVGAQKAGTTSLQDWLCGHPQVHEPRTKELHYFTLNATKSVDWYRAQFPRRELGGLTGEATPYYLFHPAAAERAHAVVPAGK